MKIPETPKAALFEKQAWENIINSADWTVYRNALREHIAYLQEQVNSNLSAQKNVEAYGQLMAMKDCKRFLDSISTRMTQLNEISEKGENNGKRIR